MSLEPERVQAVFLEAAPESAAGRAAVLDRECGTDALLRQRVETLLRAHDAPGDFLGSPDIALAATFAEQAVCERPGTIIGPYKLLEQIGEGGFGVVFMAEQQQPVRRKVALKVIKAGMDTRQVVARFEAERQALAIMDHPNIAKVLDGGTTAEKDEGRRMKDEGRRMKDEGEAVSETARRTDSSFRLHPSSFGRPYFVMELVRGLPITDFCDQNQLTPRQRLELFIPVCQAVQHAHQKGIIHRDLKPSNILVTVHDTTPVPKIIDFGVAKALGQELTDKTLFTGFAQMIGTPLYMSPEQAGQSGLDIDTRSDIYSLGVLLYELLTGMTPFSKERFKTAGYDEIRHIIREEDPPRPSTRLSASKDALPSISANRQVEPAKLTRLVRGELDWIVMKCLEKDRKRRYETANGFVHDIQRYLNDEPVQACPPSAAYRLRKFVRRNKGPVLAASLVVLALVVGIIGATWGMLRATNEAKLKEDALHDKAAALAAAQESERDAKEKLWLSLYEQARARRFSRQMGQRLESLDALAKAARLRPDERLRDEAIAAMALPDVRLGPRWHAWPPGHVNAGWSFDAQYRLYARLSGQGAVSIRSVPDDREVQHIDCAPANFRSLWLSPDGRYLATLEARNDTLRVWRVADRKPLFPDAVPQTRGWAFTRDSRNLAVGQHGWVIRFDLETGKELNRWQLHDSSQAHNLAFHPDNRSLAVGHQNSSFASVYDATSGDLITKLPAVATSEQVIAWHPDGERLAVAGGFDPRIQIWNVAAKRKLATLEGHVQQVTHLSFHPDGELLISDSWDGTVRLWEPCTGRQLMQLPMTSVAAQFSSDGRWAGATNQAEHAQLLEVSPGREYRTLVSSLGAGQGSHNRDSDVSPDSQLLAYSMGDAIRLFHLASGRELALLPPGRPLFHSNGELLIVGSAGLQRWPIQPGAAAHELRLGPSRTVTLPAVPLRAARSRDRGTLAVVSEQGGMGFLVDLAADSVLPPRLDHTNAGFVALSPDGRWMASSGWHSDRVRLWNAKTGKLVHEWMLYPSRAMVFFTPDSRVLIISRGDEFSFHDVKTLKPVRPPMRRNVALYPGHVAFSPDGRIMALEMEPGVIHLKDAASARTIARLEDPHGDRAGWLSFTPDGTQLVVTALYAHAIHVWDLAAIRRRLKTMGLDWNWPEFPPAVGTPTRDAVPTIQVISAETHFNRGIELTTKKLMGEATAEFHKAIAAWQQVRRPQVVRPGRGANGQESAKQ